MSKGQKRTTGHLIERLTRKERVSPVPVTVQRIKLKDGTAGEAHFLNLSQADVPDRTYFGESCMATYENESVSIGFGQPKLGGGLRSLVLVAMTAPAAANFLRSVEAMKNPGLDAIAKGVNVGPEPLMKYPPEEPDQTASLIANVVAVAVSGRETCMDFYHANAFAHLTVQETKQMYLEPVVRVNTRTSLLLSLVKFLQETRGKFPADAKTVEFEEEAA